MDTSVVSISSFDRSSCCEPCVVLVSQSWWLSKFVLCFVAQSYLTLCDLVDCSPPGTSVLGDSPGNNIGVDCNALFQGIFPNQGSNSGLLHCRQILYCLSHQGIIGKELWKYESGYLYRRGTAPPLFWKKERKIFAPWKEFWILTLTFWDADKSFQ